MSNLDDNREIAAASHRTFSEYLAEEEDPRPRKVAGVIALVLHFLLFMVIVPDSTREPLEVTSPVAATVIKRYKPPSPPAQAKRTKRRKVVNPVPIPDPTPEEPEPVVEEASDSFVGEVSQEFVVGLPDAPPGPGGDARAGAFRAGEGGVTPPEVVRRQLPEYTPGATRSGIQGEVWIEAVVTAEGGVVEPKLLKGLPDDELNDRALESIRHWRFRPGLKDGRPVPVIAVFTVTFRLH